MNTDKRVEIGVEISWALVCGAIAVLGMRIISILTIGLSSYLQSAIRSYRGK
jgi:hypothetical protein